MDTATKTTIRLGEIVEYTDTRGHIKMAFASGTPDTCTEGDLALEPDDLHLHIVSPSCTAYSRQHVHRADEPLDGERSWRPVT